MFRAYNELWRQSMEEENNVDMTEMEEEDQQQLEEKLRQLEDDNTTYGSSENTVDDIPKATRKRNIVFDEERFEETFLKCMICREVYDESEKSPKMLPCHHTFCLDCLQQMFRVEGEYRQNLTSAFRSMPMAVKICCPTCRDGLICSEQDIKRLPNDTTILELLNYIKGSGKSDVQYCSKHKMQPLNFFCEPCITPVCCDCTVIDHKEKNGHIVMNVDEALGKYTPVLDETLIEMDKSLKAVEDKKQALEKAAENIEQIQKELAVQIRQTFNRMRDAIDERERELFNLSEHEIDKKRNEIGDQLAIVHERQDMLNKDRNNLQSAKDAKDISAMFTHHQLAREDLAKKVNIPGPSRATRDFAVSFQFNSRAENNIRSNISVFGDVSFK